jgi:hypothetical protein
MVFPSKVDAWLLWVVRLAMLLPVAISVTVAVTQGEAAAALPAVSIVLLAYLFVEWIFRSTYYMVDQDYLRIRSGPFRWRVPIMEIESIVPSRSALSSPALSLDRLRVNYAGGRWILVSPSDRDWFINALRSVNAAIQVKES